MAGGVRHRSAGILKGTDSDRDNRIGRNDESHESLADRRTTMMTVVMTRVGSGLNRSSCWTTLVVVVVASASLMTFYFSFWNRHSAFCLSLPSSFDVASSSFSSSTTTTTSSKSLLRFDWTNLGPSPHPLTQRMVAHTHNCSLSMATFAYRKRFGLGSDLHVYAQAVCNAMYANLRVRTIQPWSWGISHGSTTNKVGEAEDASPMRGLFHDSELVCPGDVQHALDHPEFDAPRPDPVMPWPLSKANGHTGNHCKTTDHDMWRLATIDMLFRHVTPRLQKEAERQLQAVFGTRQAEDGTVGMAEVPHDLITVHIRWGDKVTTYTNRRSPVKAEMDKVQIDAYIDAVHQILDRRRRRQQEHQNSGQERKSSNTANIYLATEDPAAVEAFQAILPDGWRLYVDQFLTETIMHRVNDYNGHNKMAQSEAMKGKAGLMALGSLLVAMEANDFVLTTASNWSLLMNELRKAILDPQCGNCTTLIDLRPAKS